MTAMQHGSISDADRLFVETWENLVDQRTAIVKLTARGEETRQLINRKGTFFVTSEERILTEGIIADPKNNPFRNGRFRPVIVPPSVEVEANPNSVSDEEISTFLKASDLAWSEFLDGIDSPETMSRVRNIAYDDPQISLSRFREVEARLEALRPVAKVSQKDRQMFESLGT